MVSLAITNLGVLDGGLGSEGYSCTMSIQAFAWVLEHSNARLSQRLVLLSIANHLNDETGKTWLSYRTLSKEARITERQAIFAVKKLEQGGHISVDRGKGKNGTNVFTIHGMRGDEEYSEGVKNPSVGGEDSGNGGVNFSTEGDENFSPVPKERTLQTVSKNVPLSGKQVPPEAETLCKLLALLITENGSKPPVVSAKWLTEARLLLERDKRDPNEAAALIRWCQQDPFWKANILSMPKFRQKYDQLRLKALGQQEHEPGRQLLEMARRLEEMDEGAGSVEVLGLPRGSVPDEDSDSDSGRVSGLSPPAPG